MTQQLNMQTTDDTAPVNPVDAVLLDDPAANAIWGKCAPIFAQLSAVPVQLGEALAARRQAQAALDMNQDLSYGGRVKQRGQINNTALQRIDAAYAGALVATQRLDAILDPIIAPQSGTPDAQAALLAELQLQRAWARLCRQLDTLDDGAAVLRVALTALREASKTGDRATVDALRQELPAYLKARHMPGDASALREAFDAAEAPFVPAQKRAALQIHRAAVEGWQRLVAAVGMARNEAREDGSRAYALPGWASGAQVNINV